MNKVLEDLSLFPWEEFGDEFVTSRLIFCRFNNDNNISLLFDKPQMKVSKEMEKCYFDMRNMLVSLIIEP